MRLLRFTRALALLAPLGASLSSACAPSPDCSRVDMQPRLPSGDPAPPSVAAQCTGTQVPGAACSAPVMCRSCCAMARCVARAGDAGADDAGAAGDGGAASAFVWQIDNFCPGGPLAPPELV